MHGKGAARERAEPPSAVRLFKMAQRGLLRAKIEKSYPLAEAKSAIAHASQAKRSGKIVFEL